MRPESRSCAMRLREVLLLQDRTCAWCQPQEERETKVRIFCLPRVSHQTSAGDRQQPKVSDARVRVSDVWHVKQMCVMGVGMPLNTARGWFSLFFCSCSHRQFSCFSDWRVSGAKSQWIEVQVTVSVQSSGQFWKWNFVRFPNVVICLSSLGNVC